QGLQLNDLRLGQREVRLGRVSIWNRQVRSTQLNSPTTSNRLSFRVWMTTVSLRGPRRFAAWPLTLTSSNLFCAGSRSFTCTSLGDPERASSTEAAMLFAAGMATSLKLILPQRVGAR